jgi:hypothetical protein
LALSVPLVLSVPLAQWVRSALLELLELSAQLALLAPSVPSAQ